MWKKMIPVLTVIFAVLQGNAVSPYEGQPFPDRKEDLSRSEILMREEWSEQKLSPVRQCSDAVFIRRVYLDVTGRLPSEGEVWKFLNDKSPDKRSLLIDTLLESPAHADLIAMRFADFLRIKSEFPVNLWPNAVQAWHEKLREDIFADRPYSQMVREMLTASGSNFRVPYSNFFRSASVRTPEGRASVAALSFMGVRTEKLSPERQKEFAQFFSLIRMKSTKEWKEEIVYTEPSDKIIHAKTPDGTSFRIDPAKQDPREVFADWLIREDNPYFARAFVNRAWQWFFGKGLIEPADDISPEPGTWTMFLRSALIVTPPENEVHEKLLQYLSGEFINSGYSMRYLFRLILNTPAYHAAPHTKTKEQVLAEKYFAVYPVHRINAEVFCDILARLTGSYESYSSVIPEPFTFLPRGTPAVNIADGSISSSMLNLFGRSSRDSGLISERNNHVNFSQRLYLMNSGRLYYGLQRIANNVSRQRKMNVRQKITGLYVKILSRPPAKEEMEKCLKNMNARPAKERGKFWFDLTWSLVNSKEFLYHH